MNRKMCIFDLDGTLNLKDQRLSIEILKLSKMGVNFIVSTGRSNNYVLDTFKKNRILPPRYIIADNGGSVYDTRKKSFLRKTQLPISKRKAVVSEFLRLGGKAEDIRFSDGINLYVAEDSNVKRYYANDSVIYCKKEDIVNRVLNDDSDVIKITLAGSLDQMKRLQAYIKDNKIKCFTDIGSTSFPVKSRGNFRLDVTDGQMSKGQGVRFLVERLGIDKFLCVGNGLNDFSMFKYAIDTGNKVLIVKNYESGKLQKESEDLIRLTENYARECGRGKSNLIFVRYPVNGRVGSMEEKEYSRQKNKEHIKGVRRLNKVLVKKRGPIHVKAVVRKDKRGQER